MYAAKVSDAMQAAIDETNRRRTKQITYNQDHSIEPASIIKEVRDLTRPSGALKAIAEQQADYVVDGAAQLPKNELRNLIEEMEKQMKAAAKSLEFEKAAMMRDQIFELRTTLAEDDSLKPWETHQCHRRWRRGVGRMVEGGLLNLVELDS